ncbi:hypothetical protein [Muricoccus radiodurans]|uniref:hypothetical protein n=1 Tax=Muricoccus radiodurans TaxID=2231721 RepID=UPI003CF5F14B
MRTRIIVSLGFSLLLSACGGRVSVLSEIGLGDPLRAAAQDAPFAYGRPGAVAGNPARAAWAAAEIEWFANALETDPLWSTPRDATLQPVVQIARREVRQALGIAPGVPPRVAIAALGSAADALARGDRRAAEAALDAPGFPGGAATLARLGSVTRLPRVEEAAQALANEANGPRGGERG